MKKNLLKVLFIISCFGCCYTNTANCQTNRHRIDSLLNVINATKRDSMEVLTLVRVSKDYCSFQIDSAHYFCDKALSLAKKIDYNVGLRFALKIKGVLYQQQAKYDSALVFFNLLKEQCENINNQTCWSEFYNNSAMCYEGLGNFTMALKYYLEAAKINEAQNDYRRLCVAYINIAGIYRIYLNDYNASYTYSLKAIELAEKNNDIDKKGEANEQAAGALMELNRLDSSLYYAKKSLEYYQQLTSCPDCIVGLCTVIAEIFLRANNIDSALTYTTKAVAMGKNITQQEYYADALTKHSKLLSRTKQYQLALDAANEALGIANELEKFDLSVLVYEALIICYENNKDYKNVSLYKDMLTALQDSLNSIEIKNNLNNLKLKYETEKKENEISKLNTDKKIQQLELEKQKATIAGNLLVAKQKQTEIDLLNQQQQIQNLNLKQQAEALTLKSLETDTKDKALKIAKQEKQLNETELEKQRTTKNLILAGAIALLAFIVLGFNQYRLNLLRKNEKDKYQLQNQLSEMRLEALRSQMNPHFIFNALNSINRYIIRSDKIIASDYLVKFSKLMRLVLENSKAQFVPLQNELDAVRLYAEIEGLRFENKFDFAITVSEDIKKELVKIPPMVLQPFIENAIWHGLTNKNEKGNIQINVSEKEIGKLFVVIEDNGIGRQKATELKNNSMHTNKSFGMEITKERIKTMTGSDKNFNVIDLFDKQNNPTGTRVEISLKYSA